LRYGRSVPGLLGHGHGKESQAPAAGIEPA